MEVFFQDVAEKVMKREKEIEENRQYEYRKREEERMRYLEE